MGSEIFYGLLQVHFFPAQIIPIRNLTRLQCTRFDSRSLFIHFSLSLSLSYVSFPIPRNMLTSPFYHHFCHSPFSGVQFVSHWHSWSSTLLPIYTTLWLPTSLTALPYGPYLHGDAHCAPTNCQRLSSCLSILSICSISLALCIGQRHHMSVLPIS